jgi:hypothetical protein
MKYVLESPYGWSLFLSFFSIPKGQLQLGVNGFVAWNDKKGGEGTALIFLCGFFSITFGLELK